MLVEFQEVLRLIRQLFSKAGYAVFCVKFWTVLV